ncbi:MAG: metallophosphoesterase family protein [Alistipes sp.]
MKQIIVLIFAVMMLPAQAQHVAFRQNGTLLIAQFTDTHIDFSTPERSLESQKAIAQMEYILETEKPDVLLFTGDVVTGKPSAKGWKTLLTAIDRYGIPFAVMLGNHDREQDLSAPEIAAIVTSYKTNITLLVKGKLADCAIEVADHTGKKVEALLYCLDSNDYSTVENMDGYGWITAAQIAWYRTLSQRYTKANNNKPLPALAFFHIPLPEYLEAKTATDKQLIGQRTEDECPGVLNTGLFAAFVECGDVFGVFTGHDHNNDYLLLKQGIALAYGRFSGYKTTYTDLKHGARLIEMKQGTRSFDTWIKERDGAKVDYVTCDGVQYIKH